jgi:hypothetical protein
MKSRVWMLAGVLALAIPSFAAAQTATEDSSKTAEPQVGQKPPIVVTETHPDYPRGRISGLMFGDYYYNSGGDPTHHYTSSGADSDQAYINGVKNVGRDLQGFALRRIYFQLDNDLSVKYSTRFRLEVDNSALTSTGKLTVFVKNAYVQAKNIIPRGTGYFGMITTPFVVNSEVLWGYRAVEKTIADFRGIISSADLGAELSGFLDSNHKWGYNAMVGNGTGQSPENNRYKRAYVSLPLIPVAGLTIEPYWDYMGAPADKELATYKLLAGYEAKKILIGVDAVEQIQHSSTVNTKPFGYSIFARTTRQPKVNAFARFDHWETNKGADNRVDSDFYIAGLDWTPVANIHVMPNIEAMQYSSKGTAVAPAYDDFQWRLTFWYAFSKPQS